jgi:hypothetical protein
MRVSVALLMATGMLVAGPAGADLGSAPVFSPGVLATNAALQSVQQQEETRAAHGGAPGRPNSPAASAGKAVRAIALTYTVTPAQRRSTLAHFVSRLRADHPDMADQVQRAFVGHDYGVVYDQLAGTIGMQGGDVSKAITAYLLLGWSIAKRAPEPSPTAIAAARAQMVRDLGRDPRLADMATREQLGEEFKLRFVMVHSGWQSAQREGTSARYADGIASLYRKESDLDLRGLTLGKHGFARKG